MKDKYWEELNHIVLTMESGLCGCYCLEAGFLAPAAQVVWLCAKRRHHVMQQLKAENCMWTSKRNKCCVEKKLDLDPPNCFPKPCSFQWQCMGAPVKYCEITDVNMGSMSVPCRVPSLEQHSKEEGKARTEARKTATAAGWKGLGEHERGRRKRKMLRSLARTPPEYLTARYYWVARMHVFYPSCYFKLRVFLELVLSLECLHNWKHNISLCWLSPVNATRIQLNNKSSKKPGAIHTWDLARLWTNHSHSNTLNKHIF